MTPVIRVIVSVSATAVEQTTVMTTTACRIPETFVALEQARATSFAMLLMVETPAAHATATCLVMAFVT